MEGLMLSLISYNQHLLYNDFHLLGGELLPEGFWHCWWWRSREVERHFHTIVNEPLEGGEGADHDDTRDESLPHAHWSEILENLAGRRFGVLVQHGND